jgi:hypothetical protein
MLVRFTKKESTASADLLTCVRTDGSMTSAEMAREGVLPHDACHFVVESVLGWHDAFFGQVARGGSLQEIGEKVHGQKPKWSKITQALQAEALVECFQSEQWSGPADPADFAQKLISECRRRGVSPPDITPEELERVRVALREFGAAWRPLPPQASLERTFGT